MHYLNSAVYRIQLVRSIQMVAVLMMKIIILKRMKIKLILLLSGDLEGQYSPKLLSLMPRSPLKAELTPHFLLELRPSWA